MRFADRKSIRDVVEDYEILVRRNEHMSNAEIAAHLGMKQATLERALNRARKRGLLSIRRTSYFGHVELARHGETNGFPVRVV